MTLSHSQRGSTLLVALIMLVLMTLMAISAMSSTTTSIQMVGNAQFREEAGLAGQRAIEKVLSSTNFMTAPPPDNNIDINNDGTTDYIVEFHPEPKCISYRAVIPGEPGVPLVCTPGAGMGVAALCFWTVWDIAAVVSDPTTGANMVMHQGVRTIAGLNAALANCMKP